MYRIGLVNGLGNRINALAVWGALAELEETKAEFSWEYDSGCKAPMASLMTTDHKIVNDRLRSGEMFHMPPHTRGGIELFSKFPLADVRSALLRNYEKIHWNEDLDTAANKYAGSRVMHLRSNHPKVARNGAVWRPNRFISSLPLGEPIVLVGDSVSKKDNLATCLRRAGHVVDVVTSRCSDNDLGARDEAGVYDAAVDFLICSKASVVYEHGLWRSTFILPVMYLLKVPVIMLL